MCWKNYMIWKKKTKIPMIIFQAIYKRTLSYCLKCRKNRQSKNPNVSRTKDRRIMLLSKCAVCDIKNINKYFLKSNKLKDY